MWFADYCWGFGVRKRSNAKKGRQPQLQIALAMTMNHLFVDGDYVLVRDELTQRPLAGDSEWTLVGPSPRQDSMNPLDALVVHIRRRQPNNMHTTAGKIGESYLVPLISRTPQCEPAAPEKPFHWKNRPRFPHGYKKRTKIRQQTPDTQWL